MFHPHFLRLFFGIPHSTADAMTLVAAFKVEEDLQDKRRKEGEREIQAAVGESPERAREKFEL